jgi:DNA-directed RNA polymerase subunit RPC12/RpoP
VAWKLVIVAVVLVVGGVIGVNYGWAYVLGPLLGYAVYRYITGNLRALMHGSNYMVDDDAGEPTPVSGDERTLYWCEECGTEVMLLVRGTPRAPSHCGQRMHERTELLRPS